MSSTIYTKLDELTLAIDVEGMNNISIIDFFNEDVDSKSISFTQALTRAVLMLDIEELSDKPNKTDFRKSIDRLTNYRNRLIHFSLDLNFDEVTVLLSKLLEPLLRLLKTHIQDSNFRDIAFLSNMRCSRGHRA